MGPLLALLALLALDGGGGGRCADGQASRACDGSNGGGSHGGARVGATRRVSLARGSPANTGAAAPADVGGRAGRRPVHTAGAGADDEGDDAGADARDVLLWPWRWEVGGDSLRLPRCVEGRPFRRLSHGRGGDVVVVVVHGVAMVGDVVLVLVPVVPVVLVVLVVLVLVVLMLILMPVLQVMTK